MILSVSNGIHQYEVSLEPITQLCGHNLVVKNYVIDSFVKYFSSGKYAEYENKMIDNIKLDDEKVGRQYFQTYRICGRDDLLQLIKNTKVSLLMKHIRMMLDKFVFQNELENIDNGLMQIFNMLNGDMAESLGNVAIDYDREELFSIIQKSNIVNSSGESLEHLSTEELFDIFLNLVNKMQAEAPTKTAIVFQNIDHLIDVHMFKAVVDKCEKVARDSDTWFLFSCSIGGYVCLDENKCTGITVFNEDVYRMPEYEHLKDYILNTYPYEKKWEEEQFISCVERIIHNIADSQAIMDLDSGAVQKLINQTIGIPNRMKNAGNSMLLSFMTS